MDVGEQYGDLDKQLESKVCAMVVAPVVPEVSMEECTEANQGATVWETVSLPTTEGVTYTQETSASHVVTVTTTAGEGSR